MAYKLVIFDLDGTLLDTSEGFMIGVRHAMAKMNLPERSDAELKTLIGPRVHLSFPKMFGVEGDELVQMVQYFWEGYRGENLFKAQPFEGMLEALAKLRADGYLLAVATNKLQEQMETVLGHFGLDKCFDYLCGADVERKLDKPDIIRLAINKSGLTDSREAVMVGDTHLDAQSAAKVGVDFIGVTYGFGYRVPADVDDPTAIGAAATPLEVVQVIEGKK
jgi:phosphoglycolate phosphatase